jgi:hypothetical protein
MNLPDALTLLNVIDQQFHAGANIHSFTVSPNLICSGGIENLYILFGN